VPSISIADVGGQMVVASRTRKGYVAVTAPAVLEPVTARAAARAAATRSRARDEDAADNDDDGEDNKEDSAEGRDGAEEGTRTKAKGTGKVDADIVSLIDCAVRRLPHTSPAGCSLWDVGAAARLLGPAATAAVSRSAAVIGRSAAACTFGGTRVGTSFAPSPKVSHLRTLQVAHALLSADSGDGVYQNSDGGGGSGGGGGGSGFSSDDRRQLSTSQPIDGLSLESGRHFNASQPISGLSLDDGRQVSTSQPISGLSLDGSRQLSVSQPIRGGGGSGDREVERDTLTTLRTLLDEIDPPTTTSPTSPSITAAPAVPSAAAHNASTRPSSDPSRLLECQGCGDVYGCAAPSSAGAGGRDVGRRHSCRLCGLLLRPVFRCSLALQRAMI